jgi:mono/diheme cytochrome c family protein
MVRLVVVFSVVLCLEMSVPAQQNPAPPSAAPAADYKVPAEAARQTNPVKPTPENTERAKKLYGYDCAMCHGKNGDGKGDMAGDMKVPLADFTDPASLKGFTDGELFYIIKNGKGEMPPEGDRAKVNETWSLIAYVRSFAKKTATAPVADKPAAQ